MGSESRMSLNCHAYISSMLLSESGEMTTGRTTRIRLVGVFMKVGGGYGVVLRSDLLRFTLRAARSANCRGSPVRLCLRRLSCVGFSRLSPRFARSLQSYRRLCRATFCDTFYEAPNLAEIWHYRRRIVQIGVSHCISQPRGSRLHDNAKSGPKGDGCRNYAPVFEDHPALKK